MELPTLEYWKKKFLKNEKMANRKLGNLQNLGNLGNIILRFRFCPGAKIKNSDLKISEKNFRDFRVFDLASNFPRLKETIMTPLLGHEIGVYSNLQPRNFPRVKSRDQVTESMSQPLFSKEMTGASLNFRPCQESKKTLWYCFFLGEKGDYVTSGIEKIGISTSAEVPHFKVIVAKMFLKNFFHQQQILMRKIHVVYSQQ